MDTSRIEDLIKLMDEHGLAELEIESEGFKVKLKKAGNGAEIVHVTTPTVVAHPVQSVPAAAAAPAATEEAGEGESEEAEVIRSPMVGTFFKAPSPEDPAFVKVGDPVDEDTVVCVVEAMKVMNEVRAEVVGTISKVLVENGKPVEFGQPLFEVVA